MKITSEVYVDHIFLPRANTQNISVTINPTDDNNLTRKIYVDKNFVFFCFYKPMKQKSVTKKQGISQLKSPWFELSMSYYWSNIPYPANSNQKVVNTRNKDEILLKSGENLHSLDAFNLDPMRSQYLKTYILPTKKYVDDKVLATKYDKEFEMDQIKLGEWPTEINHMATEGFADHSFTIISQLLLKPIITKRAEKRFISRWKLGMELG